MQINNKIELLLHQVEEDGNCQIFVKGFDGHIFIMNIHPLYNVSYLKALLWKKGYGNPGDLRLISSKYNIDGCRSLASLDIKKHTTIHLTGRLGPSHETRNRKVEMFMQDNYPIKKYIYDTKNLILWKKWFKLRSIIIYWKGLCNYSILC